jgi:hypothetical protein
MSLEGKTKEEIEQMESLAVLSSSLLADPKSATKFKRLLKEANPNLSMPEVEIEDQLAARDAAHKKEMDELRGESAQRKAIDQANALYEAVRDKGACSTRDSFNKLVKYASDHGFQTSEAGLLMAASHFRAENEAAEPNGGLPQAGFELNGNTETSKDFMKDPRGTALKVADAALKELAKDRARGQVH